MVIEISCPSEKRPSVLIKTPLLLVFSIELQYARPFTTKFVTLGIEILTRSLLSLAVIFPPSCAIKHLQPVSSFASDVSGDRPYPLGQERKLSCCPSLYR